MNRSTKSDSSPQDRDMEPSEEKLQATKRKRGAGEPAPAAAAASEAVAAPAAEAAASPTAASKRARYKKPADMPRRPLSAYNLYFKAQRALLLEERKAQPVQDDSTPLFSSMARTIAARWKTISPEELAHYTELAEREQERYHAEMEIYNLRILKGTPNESSATKPQEGQPTSPDLEPSSQARASLEAHHFQAPTRAQSFVDPLDLGPRYQELTQPAGFLPSFNQGLGALTPLYPPLQAEGYSQLLAEQQLVQRLELERLRQASAALRHQSSLDRFAEMQLPPPNDSFSLLMANHPAVAGLPQQPGADPRANILQPPDDIYSRLLPNHPAAAEYFRQQGQGGNPYASMPEGNRES